MLMDGHGVKYHGKSDKQSRVGKSGRSYDSYQHANKRNPRKPAQQLYRPPGVRDQDSGKPQEIESADSDPGKLNSDSIKSVRMTVSNNGDTSDGKVMHEAGDSKYRLKKPDMAIYIPPQRMHFIKDGEPNGNSDNACDKAEDFTKLLPDGMISDHKFFGSQSKELEFPSRSFFPAGKDYHNDKHKTRCKSERKSTSKSDGNQSHVSNNDDHTAEMTSRNYAKRNKNVRDIHRSRRRSEGSMEDRKTQPEIPSLLSLVIENPPLCQHSVSHGESNRVNHIHDTSSKSKLKKDKFTRRPSNSLDKRRNNQESEIHKDEKSSHDLPVALLNANRNAAGSAGRALSEEVTKVKVEAVSADGSSDEILVKGSKPSFEGDSVTEESENRHSGIIQMPNFNWADDDDDGTIEEHGQSSKTFHEAVEEPIGPDVSSDSKKVSKRKGRRPRISSSCSDAQSDEGSKTKGGILILKQHNSDSQCQSPPQSFSEFHGSNERANASHRFKQLYDPKNPKKPEVVQGLSVRDQFHHGDKRNCHFELPGAVPLPPMPQDTYPGHPYGYPYPGFEGYPPPFPHPGMYNGQIPPALCQNKKIPPGLLYWLNRGECDIMGLLMSGNFIVEWDKLNQIRSLMKRWFQQVLVLDLEFCETQNIEQTIWKCLYYQLIELLRKSLSDSQEPSEKPTLEGMLTEVLEDGTLYFEKLLDVLQDNNRFKLSDFLDQEGVVKPRGAVRFAVISAQKIFLYLGDLARYRGPLGDEAENYSKAKSWYCKAQRLNPKNGRPYNQLAIISLYNRRKLDAVYYYMRSLMSSNPFQSAKESLLSLFHETSKKWESNVQKPEKDANKVGIKNKDREKIRCEIWIRHGDNNREQRLTTTTTLDANQDNGLADLSFAEVNKRFVLSFLHVHSKLYSKINMETFTEAGVLMLKEFRALLNFDPVSIAAPRLLQLLALNMFSIETHHLKDSTTRLDDGKYRSPYQENAMNISLEMFSLLLEKCNCVLKTLKGKTDLQFLGEELEILLAGVKIWCDWLISHPMVWNPPPSSTEYKVGPASDPWKRFAELINHLSEWNYKAVTWSSKERKDYYPVRLIEDDTFAGFTPLMACTLDPFFVPKGTNSDLAKNCIRVDKIMFCGREYLCGVEPPILKYVRDKDVYISIVQFPDAVCSRTEKVALEEEFAEEEFRASLPAVNAEPLSPDTAPSEILLLRHRKEELERHHQSQEKHRQQVQAILDGTTTIEMEIRPRYLVPDTNCFIDYLDDVLKLCECGHYTILVPLVVLNELDGLARGNRSSRYATQEHAMKVTRGARQALSFLRQEKHPRIRFVTSRGTLMSSSTFTTEEDSEVTERNDDRILSCCIEFQKEKHPEVTVSDSKEIRHLFRELVLLTDDRNLRVKALTADVPVRELPDFLHWAGVG